MAARDASVMSWGDEAEADSALDSATAGIGGMSLSGAGGAAAGSAVPPAVDTSYGRDRAAKLDPTAADTSRNEITMKGPVDYAAKTDEVLGSGRTIANARWEDLLPGSAGEVLRNGVTKKCAWERPTPVQQASIAAARIKMAAGGMMSPHIIGQAENGAGKTGAFCIASLIRCGKASGKPNVLIIVPKQELAMQAVETLDKLTSFYPEGTRPKVVAVLPEGRSKGGAAAAGVATAVGDGDVVPSMPGSRDGVAVMNDASIVAVSPGKLESILQGKPGRFKALDVSDLRCIVMDEVDELLEDNSVRTSLKKILRAVKAKPALFAFSATFDPISLKPHSMQADFLQDYLGGTPQDFLCASAPAPAAATATASATAVTATPAGRFSGMEAAYWLRNRAPIFITVRALTMPTITHLVWRVPKAAGQSELDAKMSALASIMTPTGLSQTKSLIFCNQNSTVESVKASLEKVGCHVHAMSGKLETSNRRRLLNDFKRGTTHSTLVSTNVLAKGVDIESLRLVVHFDIPVAGGGGGGGRGRGRGRGRGGGRGGGSAGGGGRSSVFDQVMFIHRSGRVGRGGRHGVVLSLVASSAEFAHLNSTFAAEDYRYHIMSFDVLLAAVAVAGITDTGTAAKEIVRVLDDKPQGADGQGHVRSAGPAGQVLASNTEAGNRVATVDELHRAVINTIKDEE